MKRQRAFTLVELLVVIGIVALLISILLPALSKARQQASKAACLSNLHNMSLALGMYTNQSKGVLPFGTCNLVNASGTVFSQTWGGLLSVQMGLAKGAAADLQANASENSARGIFVCKDAIQTNVMPLNTYTVHPNLMPEMHNATTGTVLIWANEPNAFGGQAGQPRRPYRVTQIPSPADIVLMWDGVQNLNNGNAYAVGFALDNRQLAGVATPKTYNSTAYANRNGVDLGQSIDGGVNRDSLNGDLNDLIYGNIRWRHSGNKAANFLYVDGHADSLNYSAQKRTGLLRRNICVPAPR